MKKIKRPLFVATIIAIACNLNTGCSKKETLKETQEFHISEKSLFPEEKQAYMSQISFVTSTEADRKIDSAIDVKLLEKADDPTVDWTYFDKVFNDGLSNPKKQDIGYAILCKKDLIGQVNKNPENTELVAALKKYVDILVKTEYIGYTSLYFALQTLKSIDQAFAKEKAVAILKYAKKDTVHTDIINHKENMDIDKVTYDKYLENFKYVSRIATLS